MKTMSSRLLLTLNQAVKRSLASNVFPVVLMLVIGALAYLLWIRSLGFYGDDWYLIYDGVTQGPGFFKVVFSIDRPARAYLMSLAFNLFGTNLVLYHLAAFAFRTLGVLAFYWALNLVWKGNKVPNFLIALFFFIYPGFLMQVQPVDYLSHILSMCLGMISIALTVKAVKVSSWIGKLIFGSAAVLSGWAYLLLIEFHIGLEFLRLLLVILAAWGSGGRPFKRLVTGVLRWLPYAVIPAVFVAWRFLVFNNVRAATDMGLQLGALVDSPLQVGTQWSLSTLTSVINTLLAGWIVPWYQFLGRQSLGLQETFLVLGIGLLAALLAALYLLLRRRGSQADQAEDTGSRGWQAQAFWVGSLSLLAGFAAVILGNRSADLEFSRYMILGAPGAAMLLAAVLSLLASSRLRGVLAALVVFISVSTHAANAVDHVHQAESLRDFWWQVSWRAPAIEAGTNLIASYAEMEAPEEYITWGPANLVYFPEKQEAVPIKIQLPASLPNRETVTKVMGGGYGRDRDRRGNHVHEDLSAVLVLTQPEGEGCVRFLDGAQPELSPADPYEIMLLAPYSLIGNVNLSDQPAQVPEGIFGPEPEHAWCYFYQKASLARQFGDWQTVLQLGTEAIGLGLTPGEAIEWLPFLQAYAVAGSAEALEPFAALMNADPLVSLQTCRILKDTAREYHPQDLALQAFIEDRFCIYSEAE